MSLFLILHGCTLSGQAKIYITTHKYILIYQCYCFFPTLLIDILLLFLLLILFVLLLFQNILLLFYYSCPSISPFAFLRLSSFFYLYYLYYLLVRVWILVLSFYVVYYGFKLFIDAELFRKVVSHHLTLLPFVSSCFSLKTFLNNITYALIPPYSLWEREGGSTLVNSCLPQLLVHNWYVVNKCLVNKWIKKMNISSQRKGRKPNQLHGRCISWMAIHLCPPWPGLAAHKLLTVVFRNSPLATEQDPPSPPRWVNTPRDLTTLQHTLQRS